MFANSIKYLKATLASSFGNFYAIAIGSLFISFLLMLPLQILLVNLLSDFPMISIATDNVDAAELSRPSKYEIREIVLIATLLGVVSTVFNFMFFAVFVQQGAETLQTNWFMGSILTELVFLFSTRSKLPFYKANRPSWLCPGTDGVCQCSDPRTAVHLLWADCVPLHVTHGRAPWHYPWPGWGVLRVR